jgi:hypothetical protein
VSRSSNPEEGSWAAVIFLSFYTEEIVVQAQRFHHASFFAIRMDMDMKVSSGKGISIFSFLIEEQKISLETNNYTSCLYTSVQVL